MREIAEIELAIQGGTEKIEVYGPSRPISFPPDVSARGNAVMFAG